LKNGAAVWAAALALVAGACSTGERDTMNQETGAESPAATAPAGESADPNGPVTVTGCLQQGEGSDFILTQAREESGAIATSGQADAGAVPQQQRQAAARSYRLSGGPENLREMVGQQVRISGTMDDRGNLQQEGEQPREGEIDADDLAEVEVTSAESVAPTCGTRQ
jgi:hypothetical protein